MTNEPPSPDAEPKPNPRNGEWQDDSPVDWTSLPVKILVASRYFFLVAVASTYMATLVLLGRGAWDTGVLVANSLGLAAAKTGSSLHAQALKIVDTFLVATVLYVLATGFFQIFVRSNLPLPRWMRISGPGAMESQLVGVIVTVMAVTALVRLTEWDGVNAGILPYGLATAALIASISLFKWVHHAVRKDPNEE